MTTTISTIAIEPNATISTELNNKENFAKRFKPTNLNRNDQSKRAKQSSAPKSIVRPLQAEDIKEHRLWALLSTIFCFFLIGPCIALYHSRRVRTMKKNEQLVRAEAWSDRVRNILVISNIIGAVIWFAIIFVIAVLCVMGAFY